MRRACPDAESLELHAIGRLDPAPRRAAEAHLKICSRCRDRLAEVKENLYCEAEVEEALRTADSAPIDLDLDGFTVLRELGRGGMGVVYEAQQERPRRRVALKVLRAGHTSKRALQRFEYEAEVLARLDHPGIARIHAAGTLGGGERRRPYFVMEPIEGRPLMTFVRAEACTLRQRVLLFARICDAVEYAHQRGVLHRDLKPANLLVTADGQPVVLDFGVARAADPGGGAQPETLVGEVVGTLPYMSPEQMIGDPALVDLRTDVYSLGVILYELLSGQLPLDLRGDTVHRALRRIEQQEPVLLGKLCPGAVGDLESIAARALEKAPARRYPSAGTLAADVRRYLRDEPVEARRPTPLYRIHKFVRRHRKMVVVAALFLGAVVVGMAATTLQWQRAVAAERQAEQEADDARAVRDFLMKALVQASPDQRSGGTASIEDVFAFAARRVEREFEGKPLVQAELHHTVGWTLLRRGRPEAARPHLERALKLRQEHLGAEHWDTARCVATLGSLRIGLGEPEAAEKLLREALGQRLRLRDPALVEDAETLREFATNSTHLALCRALQQDVDGALSLQHEAIALCRRTVAAYPSELVLALSNAATFATQGGRFDEAVEEWCREAIARARELPPAEFEFLITPLSVLADCERSRGELGGAFWHLHRAARLAELGNRPPPATRLRALADALAGEATAPEASLPRARLLLLRTLAGDRAHATSERPPLHGPGGDPSQAEVLLHLGAARRRTAQPEEAEVLLLDACRQAEVSWPPEDPRWIELDDELGETYRELELAAEAERFYLRGFDRCRNPRVDPELRHRSALRLRDHYERTANAEEEAYFRELLEAR